MTKPDPLILPLKGSDVLKVSWRGGGGLVTARRIHSKCLRPGWGPPAPPILIDVGRDADGKRLETQFE